MRFSVVVGAAPSADTEAPTEPCPTLKRSRLEDQGSLSREPTICIAHPSSAATGPISEIVPIRRMASVLPAAIGPRFWVGCDDLCDLGEGPGSNRMPRARTWLPRCAPRNDGGSELGVIDWGQTLSRRATLADLSHPRGRGVPGLPRHAWCTWCGWACHDDLGRYERLSLRGKL